MEFCICLVTAANPVEASTIAQELVTRRLAACVNVVPGIRSTYRWKERIESASEVLLIIKSSRERIPELQNAVLELHSYETPEFIVLPIEHCAQAYAAWLSESLSRS